MSSYKEHMAADARLVILRTLAKERDYRLNETILTAALDSFGHRQSREWVRTQLRKLEVLGAVTLTEAGSVLVATVTRTGLDHLDLRTTIEGVLRPSPGD